MNYKIIALDLDGTLTRNDKTISDETYQALIRAQKEGLRVVLCSGRPVYGIAPLAEQLHLAEYGGYVVAYNGGTIIEWATQRVLFDMTLPDDLIPYIYNRARENGFAIMTYCGSEIKTESPDDRYVHNSSLANKMQIHPVESFVRDVDYPLHKCMIVGDPDALAPLAESLPRELEGRAEAYRSEAFYLEVVPRGIDKAVGLDHLLRSLDLAPSDLIACGDGYNDLSMIEFAGLGVAMANAKPPLLQKADYVTLSNEEDGVAHVIRKFVEK